MVSVSIIAAVSGEDSGLLVGQYSRELSLPSVPRAGEWIHIATEPSRVRDVVWFVDGEGLRKAEVYLSERRVGEVLPNTLTQLHDAGFFPLDLEGNQISWEEAAAEPAPEEAAETHV